MKLKKGSLYKIHWIDAAQSAEWSSEEDVNKFIVQHEKGVTQILSFIKESEHFYAFTTGTHSDGDYADIMLIPRDWILQIKQIKV